MELEFKRQPFLRQNPLRLFRPFDYGKAGKVEVFVKSQIEGIGFIVQAIKIHVVDRQSSFVFMKDGKGRTRHVTIFRDPRSPGNCLGKGGFSCTEIAIETNNVSGSCRLPKEAAQFLRIGELSQQKLYRIHKLPRKKIRNCRQ